MRNYFKPKPKLATLDQNKLNGKSAERLFAAKLSVALDARVYWATRTEDDSQVDLIPVLSHPWEKNRVEIIFTQVKSGKSFCKFSGENLVFERKHFNKLAKRNHHTLVCWTMVEDSSQYWFLIKANSIFFKNSYNKDLHRLSPATRFDLVRLLTSASLADGGKGIIFSRINDNEYDLEALKKLRNRAKTKYRELKKMNLINPLLGEIEFTKLGWRHMTRESRLNIHKEASYEILPVLKHLIQRTPTKHRVLENKNNFHEGRVYRLNEYLLEYDEVSWCNQERDSPVEVRVYVKILEMIGYSSKWASYANSEEEVDRRVVFKSIYYK